MAKPQQVVRDAADPSIVVAEYDYDAHPLLIIGRRIANREEGVTVRRVLQRDGVEQSLAWTWTPKATRPRPAVPATTTRATASSSAATRPGCGGRGEPGRSGGLRGGRPVGREDPFGLDGSRCLAGWASASRR